MERLLRVLLFWALLQSTVLGATVYYVSPDGDDSNPGTEQFPFQHIVTAVSQGPPASTIFLLNGSYYDDVITISGSRTLTIETVSGNQDAFLYGTSGDMIFAIAGATVQLKNLVVDGSLNGGEICISMASTSFTSTLNLTSTAIINCNCATNGAAISPGVPASPMIINAVNSTFSSNSAPGSLGGAIFCQSGELSLTNCTFFNNTADDGGAIHTTSSCHLTVTDCRFIGNNAVSTLTSKGGGAISSTIVIAAGTSFESNTAVQIGGALLVAGDLAHFDDCIFTANSAQYGGAVFNSGPLHLTNCEFVSNNASSAGAVFSTGSQQLVNSTFISNTAVDGAGAVFSVSYLDVSGSTFAFNSAGVGNGGALTSNGQLSITDSYFTSNSAGARGGALYSTGEGSSVNGSTFTSNTATYGGSVAIEGYGSVELAGCNMTSNTAVSSGGALYTSTDANATLFECSFAFNGATDGGALINFGNIVEEGSSFVSNNASNGGAIYNAATLFASQSIVQDNYATLSGGGTFQVSGGSTFQSCNFINNCAGNTGNSYFNVSGLIFFEATTLIESCSLTTSTSTTSTTSTTTSTSTSTTTTPATSTTSTSVPTVQSTHTPSTTSTATTCLDIDSDGDGYNDCIDECPLDSSMHIQSTCGCQPQVLCNCTLSLCPTITFEGPIHNNANASVICRPNSTDAHVVMSSTEHSLAVTLGWGSISELARSGKPIKTAKLTSAEWTRIITINDTMVTIEYLSSQLTGPLWPDPNLRIRLISHVSFDEARALVLSKKSGKKESRNTGSFIKFSVHITGDWGFAQDTNTLHVEFTVRAPVRERTECDSKRSWKAHDTDTSRIYRVFLSNDTATTLDFLKYCDADNTQKQVDISDPAIFNDKSGWTTTLVFPSFHSGLFYDPSFALLLGYSDDSCNPLLSWILPVSFLGGAAVVVCFFGLLVYFPPTARVLMGKRAYQIHEVRKDIKKDYEWESKEKLSPKPVVPMEHQHQQSNEIELKIITNAEEIDEL